MGTSSHREALTIVLEDDEENLLPRPTSTVQQSSFRMSSHLYGYQPIHIPILDDEELELRLGPAGTFPGMTRSPFVDHGLSLHPAAPVVTEACFANRAIDLTELNDHPERRNIIAGKRKHAAHSFPETVVGFKLTCAICMDTMEEETSTVCGHIFCHKCIVAALKAQNRCPTCRKSLKKGQIHRIYLSGSTK